MLKTPRPTLLALAALGIAFLPGCGARQSVTGAAPNPAPVTRFSLNTPVEVIAADPRGKAVLDRDIPGLMASRSYMLFEDMSLSQIASMSGGRLSQAKLDLVEADLSRL